MKLTKAGKPRKQRQTKEKVTIATVKPKTIEKVPIAESETVISCLTEENVIKIVTNHVTLVKKYKEIKEPSQVYDGGMHQFIFSLSDYNFSFFPKKKRKGKVISKEHKAALVAGKKKSNEEN